MAKGRYMGYVWANNGLQLFPRKVQGQPALHTLTGAYRLAWAGLPVEGGAVAWLLSSGNGFMKRCSQASTRLALA